MDDNQDSDVMLNFLRWQSHTAREEALETADLPESVRNFEKQLSFSKCGGLSGCLEKAVAARIAARTAARDAAARSATENAAPLGDPSSLGRRFQDIAIQRRPEKNTPPLRASSEPFDSAELRSSFSSLSSRSFSSKLRSRVPSRTGPSRYNTETLVVPLLGENATHEDAKVGEPELEANDKTADAPFQLPLSEPVQRYHHHLEGTTGNEWMTHKIGESDNHTDGENDVSEAIDDEEITEL